MNFIDAMKQLQAFEAAKPQVRAEGVTALKRLLPMAQGPSGQCRHVAAFLLGLYNGERFPFDMTRLRALDIDIFEDCMAVLRMDNAPDQEVHCYFEDGNDLFERLAQDWGIADRQQDSASCHRTTPS